MSENLMKYSTKSPQQYTKENKLNDGVMEDLKKKLLQSLYSKIMQQKWL